MGEGRVRVWRAVSILCRAWFFLFLQLLSFAAQTPANSQTTEKALASVTALSGAERERRLIESARAEGEVITYANLNTAATKRMADGFMKKYPFLKAQVASFSGTAIINRLQTETRAGKVISDVIFTG